MICILCSYKIYLHKKLLPDIPVDSAIREANPRPIPEVPDFREFEVAPEDIHFVDIRGDSGHIRSVETHINVIAKDHCIYAWKNNSVLSLIFDSGGKVIV